MFLKNRKYKSGTIWCWWRWTEVDSEYITRLHIIKTPWWAICVHWIKKPDPEPWLHDHPVTFLSYILSGGYVEWRSRNGELPQFKTRKTFNWITASKSDCHSIVEVLPNTVTLCFMGPKVREWGFHTLTDWIMWKDYYAEQRANKLKT